jgi:hypothetical protein
MTKSVLQKSCIVLILILFATVLLACVGKDDDRPKGEPNPTLVELTISGGNTAILIGGTTQPFVAELSNYIGESDAIEWRWTVSPSSAGVFANDRDNSTTFTAGQQETSATISVKTMVQDKEYTASKSIVILSDEEPTEPITPPQDYPPYEIWS